MNLLRTGLLLALSVLLTQPTAAQDSGHHHPPHDTTEAELPAEPTGHEGHHALPGAGTATMSSALAPGEPMSRDGSGTAWLPDAAPMEATHAAAGAWAFMFHAAAFPRYTAQDAFDAGTRGAGGFGAPSWAMGMAQRGVGPRGQLTARAMLSLDPLIEGGDGYPLLFQSGETFDGARLVDRQHPHDFFSELSLTYAHRLTAGTSVFGYLAYPGEPAFGPVAFMHRPSARFNPDSPLGHHWQDATHILFGVATLGVTAGPFKLDASLFTGAEPDEERLAFDEPTFDSYAARLSYSPSARLTLQASRAFLKEPEALEPGVDQWRTTASALYSAPFGGAGDLSAALVWGVNDLRPGVDAHAHRDGGIQHALLAEAALRFGQQAVYTRAEYAQKAPEELALDAHDYGEKPFDVLAVTLGTGRELFSAGGLTAMLGTQGTLYAVPEGLRSLYGDAPVSLQVYLRLSPSQMAHGAMEHSGVQRGDGEHDHGRPGGR